MLMGAQSLNFVLSAGMGVTLFLDLLSLWQMYLGTFLIGIAWAIDYPVRHSIIRDVVPEKFVVNAMAINVASWMGSAMVGRWVAGWMLDVAGPGEAYFFIAISVLLGLLFVIRVPVPSPRKEDTNREPIVKSIVLGLKYVWRNGAMRGLLLITLAANTLVFPHIQLHPVFARDVYGVGGTGLGFMSGMDGMGSMIGAVVIAALGEFEIQGRDFHNRLVDTRSRGAAVQLCPDLLAGPSGFAICRPRAVGVHHDAEHDSDDGYIAGDEGSGDGGGGNGNWVIAVGDGVHGWFGGVDWGAEGGDI